MLLRVVLADPPKMHRRRPVGHCGTGTEGSGVIAWVGLAGVPGHHTPSESWRGGFQVCHGDRPVGRGVRTVPRGSGLSPVPTATARGMRHVASAPSSGTRPDGPCATPRDRCAAPVHGDTPGEKPGRRYHPVFRVPTSIAVPVCCARRSTFRPTFPAGHAGRPTSRKQGVLHVAGARPHRSPCCVLRRQAPVRKAVFSARLPAFRMDGDVRSPQTPQWTSPTVWRYHDFACAQRNEGATKNGRAGR